MPTVQYFHELMPDAAKESDYLFSGGILPYSRCLACSL